MKNFKLLSVLLISALMSVSCLVDDDTGASFADGPHVVGFLNSFQSVAYFEDLGTLRQDFSVSLIGGSDGTPSSSDITVNYAVDPSSTATDGVEFSFVGGGGSVVIPANTTFAQIPLDINTGNFNPTEKTTLRLILTGTDSDGSTVSSLNETFDIIFVGCQSTVNTSMYQVTANRDDGASWDQGVEAVEIQSVNTFKTVTTGGWGAGTIAPDQGYTFVDICGDITVPIQGLAQGYYSNQVNGLTSDGTDGEVLDNGDMEVVYQIDFAAGARIYTNYYTKL